MAPKYFESLEEAMISPALYTAFNKEPIISDEIKSNKTHYYHCYTDYSEDIAFIGAKIYTEHPLKVRLLNKDGEYVDSLTKFNANEIDIQFNQVYGGNFFVEISFESSTVDLLELKYRIRLFAFVYL